MVEDLGTHETQHCTVFTVCSAWGTKPLKKKNLHPTYLKCDLSNKSITMYQQHSLPNK